MSLNIQEQLEEEEINQQLLEELKKLPDREKILLNLRYRERLSMKDVSTVMGCTVGNAHKIHKKILLKLKNVLQNTLEM